MSGGTGGTAIDEREVGNGRGWALHALQAFVDLLPVPLTAATRDGRSLVINQAYSDMIGLAAHEVAARTLEDALHADDVAVAARAMARVEPGGREAIEVRLRHADGHLLRAIWHLSVDAATGLVVAVVLDVSDERRLTEQLAHESRHDHLTGLANRLLVLASLERWLERAQLEQTHVAVALIDLDRFKLVNDRLGHRVGDHLLVAVAARLRAVAPAGALCGRMGGDELVVVVPDVSPDGAAHLARALEAVQHDADVLGHHVPVRASIGIAVGTDAAEQLLHQADVAAYTAKARGGGQAVVYDDDLRQRDRRRRALERRISDAVAAGRVGGAVVPIRSAEDGALRGLKGMAVLAEPPAEGVPAPAGAACPAGAAIGGAEEQVVTAELMEVARHLGHAPAILEAERAQVLAGCPPLPAGGPLLHLALDPMDFARADGVDQLLAQADDAGHPPDRLVLELTEETLVADLEGVVPQLHRARFRGARIAIDRFGAGSTSLSQLAGLPVDILKVDGAFVVAAHHRSNARTILNGLVLMGPALSVQVVMCGIATAADLTLARRLGATLVQGRHVGGPVDAAAVADLLAEDQPQRAAT